MLIMWIREGDSLGGNQDTFLYYCISISELRLGSIGFWFLEYQTKIQININLEYPLILIPPQ